jgi:hypothetical protein
MIKIAIVTFCGLLAGGEAFAQARPSRGFIETPPAPVCYNADCSSHFNHGGKPALRPQYSGVQTEPLSSLRRDPTRLPLPRSLATQKRVASYKSYPYTALSREGYDDRYVYSDVFPRTRIAYDLGLYPSHSFLTAYSYCAAPTTVYGVPLCMGSEWPFYVDFLNPVENPVFSSDY